MKGTLRPSEGTENFKGERAQGHPYWMKLGDLGEQPTSEEGELRRQHHARASSTVHPGWVSLSWPPQRPVLVGASGMSPVPGLACNLCLLSPLISAW